jgi:hypothetical protein
MTAPHGTMPGGLVGALTAATLLLITPVPAPPQTTPDEAARQQVRLFWAVGDDSWVLPLASIQWGQPERWAFTSRYVHRLTDLAAGHLLFTSAAVSPGAAGGRLSLGLLGIVSSPDLPDLRWETSATLLRTWGHPLDAVANTTYTGLEVVGGLLPFPSLTVGRYWPVPAPRRAAPPVWGFRVGIGV